MLILFTFLPYKLQLQLYCRPNVLGHDVGKCSAVTGQIMKWKPRGIIALFLRHKNSGKLCVSKAYIPKYPAANISVRPAVAN